MSPGRIFHSCLLFCTVILSGGCEQEEATSRIQVPLEHAIAADFDFDFLDVLRPAITYTTLRPEYYDHRLKSFRNLPQLDSLYLVSQVFDWDLYYFDLFSNGLIARAEYLEQVGEVKFDTTGVQGNSLKYNFNAISGFRNGRHIIVPDLNNNRDFGDDDSYSFPADSVYAHARPETLEELPVVELELQTLLNNEITSIRRKIRFYPNASHPFIYLLLDGSIDTLQNRYTTMVQLQDYWTGKGKFEGIPYDVKVFGQNLNSIFIKADSIAHTDFSRDNFLYRLKDTLKVKQTHYRIDSLLPNLHLHLTRLGELPETSGARIGDAVENYSLKDLQGQEFRLLDSVEKDFVLLDFWGTWCAPCKELTPELKEFYARNSDKLDIIGIAVDEHPEVVEAYVSENEMTWQQAFISLANRRNSISDGLKIKAYPTFILLDRNHRILMRGNTASFPRIRAFIEAIE